MASIGGTGCSCRQELFVPIAAHLPFLANDNTQKPANSAEVVVKPSKQIRMEALNRLRELVSDLRWDDEIAIDVLHQEFNVHIKITKKAIGHWFTRGIPGEHIFNIASIFGVDPAWLAGHTTKRTIRPNGLFDRQMKLPGVPVTVPKKPLRRKSS